MPPARPDILVLHYHLFKNAGTSIDEMLKRNFGAQWVEQEFPTRGKKSNSSEVEAYLAERPNIAALSSHTANLPLPHLKGRTIFPILFLRHPIDRSRSAYDFERRQIADTFGAKLAKERDFAGYVRELLAHPANRQVRNFQTYRLAFGVADDGTSELARAQRTMSTLPFVGMVERFSQSLEHFQTLISPLLPDFVTVVVRKNVGMKREETLEAKLAKIAAELGPELNQQLHDANADDLALYEIARQACGYA